MFKVTEAPKLPPVEVEFQWTGDDTFNKFKVVYNRLRVSEYADLVKQFGNPETDEDASISDMLQRLVSHFEDIEHDGTDDQLREYMFDHIEIATAILRAYTSEVIGGGAASKN